jgi:chromosome segregation ATPase
VCNDDFLSLCYSQKQENAKIEDLQVTIKSHTDHLEEEKKTHTRLNQDLQAIQRKLNRAKKSVKLAEDDLIDFPEDVVDIQVTLDKAKAAFEGFKQEHSKASKACKDAESQVEGAEIVLKGLVGRLSALMT